MRRVVVLLALVLFVSSSAPALACDPDWDWCGYSWDDVSYDTWYEPPLYAPEWYWWEVPVYEPAYVPVYEPVYQPVYEPVWAPAPAYEPAPIYEPAPVFDLAPLPRYEPVITYEPVVTYAPVVQYEPVYVPVQEAPVTPAPVVAAPVWTDPVVWSSPGSDYLEPEFIPAPAPAPVALAPDPDARRAELGLHYVTDVYVGDIVTTQGLTTTYSTSTASMSPGTSARLVATVGTGEGSSFDALLFNGRMSLSDGRPVSGAVYENRVWNGYDWVVDKYVFFQDDLEVAAVPTVPGAPIPITVVPTIAVPTDPPTSSPPAIPVAAFPAAAAPASVVPRIEDVVPAELDAPSSGPPASQPVRPRDVRVGIAVGPQADPLGRIEVLRGRRITLWARATIDGSPARVASWALASGDLTALGPVSGTGDEPLLATWRSVSIGAYPIRMLVSVDVPGEGSRQLAAAIDVIVRSPALVE